MCCQNIWEQILVLKNNVYGDWIDHINYQVTGTNFKENLRKLINTGHNASKGLKNEILLTCSSVFQRKYRQTKQRRRALLNFDCQCFGMVVYIEREEE